MTLMTPIPLDRLSWVVDTPGRRSTECVFERWEVAINPNDPNALTTTTPMTLMILMPFMTLTS